MKQYIGTKIIKAKAMTRGEYNIFRGWTIPKDENPADEGYLVEYSDGYISWSPKKQFEEAYRECDNMTFGLAIEALKKGLKVARKGWNGKGMYLWLLPEAKIPKEWCRDKKLLECFGDKDELLCLGSIRMYTHDSTGRTAVLTGWLASQSDMLSEDWYIVSEGTCKNCKHSRCIEEKVYECTAKEYDIETYSCFVSKE